MISIWTLTRVFRTVALAERIAEATAFGESIPSWPAFPDSAAALGELHRLGLRQIVLSNVDNASFDE